MGDSGTSDGDKLFTLAFGFAELSETFFHFGVGQLFPNDPTGLHFLGGCFFVMMRHVLNMNINTRASS